MRIGTWNLAGRWTLTHERLLRDQECDVWLLTEVSDRLALDGWAAVRTTEPMAPARAWAAVLSPQSVQGRPAPHPASALAIIDGVAFCSSVLPWRSCGSGSPWTGDRHADKTAAAVAAVTAGLPAGEVVWGGDWNHSLGGREYAGSTGGRGYVKAALEQHQLTAVTAGELHRLPGCLSIDHIAVPAAWAATATVCRVDGTSLSDHDAYVVDVSGH